MIIVKGLIIAALTIITFLRAFINAKIYNNLHGTDQKLMINQEDASRESADKSSESLIFAVYCVLIFIWFKFKKGNGKDVLYNYLLSLGTIALIYLLIILS